MYGYTCRIRYQNPVKERRNLLILLSSSLLSLSPLDSSSLTHRRHQHPAEAAALSFYFPSTHFSFQSKLTHPQHTRKEQESINRGDSH